MKASRRYTPSPPPNIDETLSRDTTPPSHVNLSQAINIPSHTIDRKPPNLLINVPHYQCDTSSGAKKQQDDMDVDSELTSPSLINFETITQLPTPIINHGSFSSDRSFSTERSNSIDFPDLPPLPLEINKLRKKSSLTKLNNRAISEYKPIDRQHLTCVGVDKRINSNPVIETFDITPNQSSLINDELTKKFENSIFRSTFGDFKFVRILGTGNFSTVIMVEGPAQAKMAVKMISIPLKHKSQIRNFKYFIKRELNILYQINHPNIIKLLDYTINLSIPQGEIENGHIESESEQEDVNVKLQGNQDDILTDFENLSLDNNQLIFLNYCKGGNLFEFQNKNFKKYNKTVKFWTILKVIVKQLILAINYLHENNIIHRDIKLENVLLNYSMEELMMMNDDQITQLPDVINVTDFGLAKRIHTTSQMLSTRCGSTDYIAPEILMGMKYNGKLTDLWSVGVLIYSLLENRLPFDLPNYSYLVTSGISPSVIKRKMSKNSPAHRIAMIDWDWYLVNDLLQEVNGVIGQDIVKLKKLVDLLIVRKDKRVTIQDLVNRDEFVNI